MVAYMRSVEPVTIAAMGAIFKARCGTNVLFVDSGANEGAWSLLAADASCCSVAVEPQLGCHELLEAALRVNGPNVAGRVTLCQAVLTPSPVETKVASKSCLGNAQYVGGLMARGEVDRSAKQRRNFAAKIESHFKRSRAELVGSTELDQLLTLAGGNRWCSRRPMAGCFRATVQPAAPVVALWHLGASPAYHLCLHHHVAHA